MSQEGPFCAKHSLQQITRDAAALLTFLLIYICPAAAGVLWDRGCSCEHSGGDAGPASPSVRFP